MQKITINPRDLDFIEQAILNNKIFFKNNTELKSFISIFCDLVSIHSIKSREIRLISSKIICASTFGLRINPNVIEVVKRQMIEDGVLIIDEKGVKN